MRQSPQLRPVKFQSSPTRLPSEMKRPSLTRLNTRPVPEMSQSREKSLASTPMTLVMVLNPNQRRCSLPNSSLIVRLLLMLPTLKHLLLPKLQLRLLLMPPLLVVLVLILVLDFCLMVPSLMDVDLALVVLAELDVDLALVALVASEMLTHGPRSVTSQNTPLLTLPMTPIPTLSLNT